MERPPARQEDLVAALQRAFGAGIVSLHRAPFEYATSAPLELLSVVLDDGTTEELIFKDLHPERMLPDAREHKPRALLEPVRAIQLQRSILDPAGVGPTCHAAVADAARERYWLICERVQGPVLWQVGNLSVWEETARWLARFQSRHAVADEVRAVAPSLLDLDADWFRMWADRAESALRSRDDAAARRLVDRLANYEQVVEQLASLPQVLVHGEFYPANVLVDLGRSELFERILPIDWEMAGLGPALLDLAALASGWTGAERDSLVEAYQDELRRGAGTGHAGDDLLADLDRCRLHQALLWIGWSPEWVPPPGRDHDWLGLALELTEKLL